MKVGVIGTGLMGEAMVERLLAQNLAVMAYNRTKSKLTSLQKAGAEVADTPREAIKGSDCTILMLADAEAIAQVIFSEETVTSLRDRTIIQMGTIAPAQSRDIQAKVVAAGGNYLEAPVLGSIPQVKSGELLVMVGASESQYQQWLQLLQHFGEEPMLIGSVGKAAALKLALNQLIAALTTGFALSLGLIQREEVDVEQFMQILRSSALYAPTFDKKLSRMEARNFADPNFPTKHLLKDINLFLEQAQLDNLDITGLEGVQQIVTKAMQMGLQEEDYSSVYNAIAPQN
ncbi:NAD(P)-dependent oxidoreductase [Oscillatoria salina]|uniref:NAD(P)-dependent oxidoreductase n=1 Tax=Oscillatoria salina TaxID=331517 RepID=UPI001CCE7160|nr:NAD(P)-dependent oxidoreductase [Oscillatoria salina]MBZ8182100.1 NAD(P)-dependent oxidoreductase [Oscillatoria salina IIICB1]